MFEQLPESSSKRERSAGQMGLSLVAHSIVIVAAVLLTEGAAAAPSAPSRTAVTFMTPPKVTPVAPPPREAVMSAVPVAQGFQTLVPPKEIPLGLPEIDLNAGFDARDYGHTGVPGGRFDGDPGATVLTANAIGREIYQSDQVDEPVQIIKAADPKYPNALRAAGIEGKVTLEFVVSSDGEVIESTLKTVGNSDPRFELAARQAILGSKYRAARFRGAAVGQLVQQSVNFTVGS